MNSRVNLTLNDIQRLIQLSQNAERKGQYVYGIAIIAPVSAAQGDNSTFAVDSRSHRSATVDESMRLYVEGKEMTQEQEDLAAEQEAMKASNKPDEKQEPQDKKKDGKPQ